ncbi:branched-chain amino acid transport system ATP-binding protein [Ancylobacter aquaticus]|uniref:Branched-chain amino acid transport system ATP-binding protein n=1 Tax=Ancylobacter aquaticus TaxID=100 RepID=A0A4R1I9W9_ANCAQ|nr:ABC transporter ATP-binding protein [Ancylobacter aquaticus]TCK30370.1 branched-chain amino acid transport system ATP-binding protein [Ancylobacter aquaticus]
MDKRPAFLEVCAVTKRYGGLVALDACTLAIATGGITGLIGPNGAGKTTLLNVMTGLVRPDTGSVRLSGVDITALPVHRFAEKGVARTFQIVRELGSLTVFENLLLAPRHQSGEGVVAALFGRRKWWAQEHANAVRARALLERIGLWHLADQPSSGLSGGQKKLLDIARALLLEPRLILLDEPGAGVSPPLKLEMIRLVRELRAEGVTFGIVEHDMHLIGELCDHVHVMAEGRLLVSGPFEQVSRDPRVVEAYLGAAA